MERLTVFQSGANPAPFSALGGQKMSGNDDASGPGLALAAGIVLAAAVRARHPQWLAPAVPVILGRTQRSAENPRNAKRDGWNHFHMAIYLTHVVFGVSQRVTGCTFDRDRTTIRYACARIEDARDDVRLDCALDVLGMALGAHAAAICGIVVGEEEASR